MNIVLQIRNVMELFIVLMEKTKVLKLARILIQKKPQLLALKIDQLVMTYGSKRFLVMELKSAGLERMKNVKLVTISCWEQWLQFFLYCYWLAF